MILLTVSLRVSEKNGEQGSHANRYWIVEIWDDVERVQSGETCRQKHLHTIRDQSLHGAGEGVEDTCCLAVIYPKLVAYLLGDVAHGENCHGVVGGTDVHHRDEGGDGEFSASLASHVRCELLDDVVDTTIFSDDLQHTTCHHGDDDELAHANHAVAYGREPTEEVVGTCCAHAIGCRHVCSEIMKSDADGTA